MTKEEMIKTIQESETREWKMLNAYEDFRDNAKNENDEEKANYWQNAVEEQRHTWTTIRCLMIKLGIETTH